MMRHKLTCPVCDRTDIEGDICPNCETNLSTFHIIADLRAKNSQPAHFWLRNTWLGLIFALVFFLIGMAVSAIGYYFLDQPKQATVVNSPPAVFLPHQSPPPRFNPRINYKPNYQSPNCGGFYYQVRPGDSLSAIALVFYGNFDDWQLISAANSQLQGRENSLEVGEIILVPNLEEYCHGNL